MCLDYKDPFNIVEEGVGWKVFSKTNGELGGFYQDVTYKENKWVKDKEDDILVVDFPTTFYYKAGFHLYQTRQEARVIKLIHKTLRGNKLIIRKVKFRKVTATGTQDGFNVIVAREIFILKDKV